MEQKGKSWLEVSLQYGATSRNVGLSILFISEFEERGVRKVTTGISRLWLPSNELVVCKGNYNDMALSNP